MTSRASPKWPPARPKFHETPKFWCFTHRNLGLALRRVPIRLECIKWTARTTGARRIPPRHACPSNFAGRRRNGIFPGISYSKHRYARKPKSRAVHHGRQPSVIRQLKGPEPMSGKKSRRARLPVRVRSDFIAETHTPLTEPSAQPGTCVSARKHKCRGKARRDGTVEAPRHQTQLRRVRNANGERFLNVFRVSRLIFENFNNASKPLLGRSIQLLVHP
jgi:hypothetical protein